MSSNKRAFLVVGPESSGTRLVTKCLKLACGCEGDYGHEQTLDTDGAIGQAGDLIAWRRSVPHGGDTNRGVPDLYEQLLRPCLAHGYHVRVFLTVRDYYCMSRSQVVHPHARSLAEALQNIPDALRRMADFVYRNDLQHEWISYEQMVRDPSSLAHAFQRQGLSIVGDLPSMHDGNARYLREPRIADADYEKMGRVKWHLHRFAPLLPREIAERTGLPLHEVMRLPQTFQEWNSIEINAAGQWSLKAGEG